MGIWFGRDLKRIERFELVRLLGNRGITIMKFVAELTTGKLNSARERKSVGAEQTFSADLFRHSEMETELLEIAGIVWNAMNAQKQKPKH